MPARTADDLKHIPEQLRRARLDTVKLFDDIGREHEQAAAHCRTAVERLDATAETYTFLVGVFASLGRLIAGGYKALDLRGMDLERHNRNILNEYVKDKAKMTGSAVAGEVWKEVKDYKNKPGAGGIVVAGMKAYELYSDFHKPSFLAGAYMDMMPDGRFEPGKFQPKWNPEKWRSHANRITGDTRTRITSTKEAALRHLDEKIRKYERLLKC